MRKLVDSLRMFWTELREMDRLVAEAQNSWGMGSPGGCFPYPYFVRSPSLDEIVEGFRETLTLAVDYANGVIDFWGGLISRIAAALRRLLGV